MPKENNSVSSACGPQRSGLVFAVICLVVEAAVALVLWKFGFSSFYSMCIAVFILVSFMVPIHKRYAKKMLMRGGVACPCCLNELAKDDDCCTSCAVGLSRAVYLEYWLQTKKSPPEANRWWRSISETEGSRGRATFNILQIHWSLGLLLVAHAVGLVVLIICRPTTLLVLGLGSMPFMLVFMFGGAWVTRTYGVRRIGTTKHCARCEYQIDPLRSEMSHCSECGGDLGKPKSIRVGKRVGHQGYMLAGIAMMVLPVVFLSFSTFFDSLKVFSLGNMLPVSLYVDDALGPDTDFMTWGVLESRYAKPEDVRRMMDVIILRTQDHLSEDTDLWLYGMSNVVAYQLDGPSASAGLKLEMALALIASPERDWGYALNNWLERYLTSNTINPQEKQALVRAAEEVFHSGEIDFRITTWLGLQRGLRLRTHSNIYLFSIDLVTLNTLQTDAGLMLAIQTNPNISLQAEDRPTVPTRVYLYTVGPWRDSASGQILNVCYDPFDYIGQQHTLAEVGFDPAERRRGRSRLIYFVGVGDQLPSANEISWHNDLPAVPQSSDTQDWYGPFDVYPVRGLPLQLSP